MRRALRPVVNATNHTSFDPRKHTEEMERLFCPFELGGRCNFFNENARLAARRARDLEKAAKQQQAPVPKFPQ